MQGLVPMSYNLWMGNSTEGASSGLHHDYHDNLYVLLQGRKRFRLYSPADTLNLYPRGNVEIVHPNGRICYTGAVTLPDGTDPEVYARTLLGSGTSLWRRERLAPTCFEIFRLLLFSLESPHTAVLTHNRQAAAADDLQAKAEARLAAAERAREMSDENAEELMREAEEDMEAALDAVLDAEEDLMDDDFDEDDEDDDEEKGFLNDDDVGDDDDGEEEDAEAAESGTAKASAASAKRIPVLTKPADKAALAALKEVPPPVSFSQINTALPAAELARKFPKFKNACSIEVEVCAGDMLYLPAGWFHEVTSFSQPGKRLHMAFNYWFHPPTALQPGRAHTPYDSAFWPREWAARGLSTPASVGAVLARVPATAAGADQNSESLDELMDSESEPADDAVSTLSKPALDDVVEELTSQGLLDYDLAASLTASMTKPTLTHTMPLIDRLSKQVARRVALRQRQARRRGYLHTHRMLMAAREVLFTKAGSY
jgi:hypothetical protein